jgi:hypothetical protein
MKTLKNITLALVLLASGVSAAQTLTYSFGVPITSSIVPYGTGPWLTIHLIEVDNYTKILMQSNLANGEFISSIEFNLNTGVDYNTLIFSNTNPIGSFTTPQFDIGDDEFNAGGGNSFDMLVEFQTSSSNGGTKRFNLNDSFEFTVNAPITTFTNLSNQLPVIAHIQGIGSKSQSTWMVPSVPEPSSVLIGFIGIITLLNRRNRYV